MQQNKQLPFSLKRQLNTAAAEAESAAFISGERRMRRRRRLVPLHHHHCTLHCVRLQLCVHLRPLPTATTVNIVPWEDRRGGGGDVHDGVTIRGDHNRNRKETLS